MRNLCVLFAVLLLYITPHSLFAQGYQVNFQGQKQQGMGLAGTAIFLDGSSLFFNPGSIAFSNENSINIAMTPIWGNTLYVDSATGEGYRSNSPMGTPFSAYGLFQHKDNAKLKLGIAAYTPFGSTVSYEDGWIGRFALTKLQLKAIFIQPTLSYRIADVIGIGGGFVISTGSVVLEKDIPVQFDNGEFATASLYGSALGFGYNLGIHYDLTKKLAIGLTYRSKIEMNVDNGTAEFNVPESLDPNFPDSTFSGALPLPQVFTLGLAYKVNDQLLFVLDINRVGWKTYDTLALDYAVNTSSLEDTKSPRMYKSTFAFRAGGMYDFNNGISLRLGGGFGFSPVQNGYITPETPDNDRWYGTAGFGYMFGKHFSVDATFYYTQMTRVGHNIETGLNGQFDTKAIAGGLGLIYKW
jgi:long-chain fatty acid transport protein